MSPQEVLIATPFTLVILVTDALFYTIIVLEKHEKVAILENKKKMFVACRR